MDADKSVSVTFVRSFTLTATIDPPEGGGILLSPNAPQNKYEDGTVVTVTATPKSGWGFKSAFGSWSGCDSSVRTEGSSQYCTVTMNSNKSVIVTLVRVYALTIIKSPPSGGDVSASPDPTNGGYPSGTKVTLTASAKPNYAIDSWTGCDAPTPPAGASNCLVTMDADKSVSVTFVRTYTLTATRTPTNAGSISVSPPPNPFNRYKAGTEITITAIPNDPTQTAFYSFDSWAGDCAEIKTPVCTVTIDKDMTVSATFIITGTSVNPTLCCPFDLRSEKIAKVECGSNKTKFVKWRNNRDDSGKFTNVGSINAWCMNDQTENRSWRSARQGSNIPVSCGCVSCGFATWTKKGSTVSFPGCNAKCVLPKAQQIEWMKVLKNNAGQVSELTKRELEDFMAGTESFSVACVPKEFVDQCKLNN